jgi:hypothetical protein
MNTNTVAIDDAVLALLHLTLHDHNRAWKGFDWIHPIVFMNEASSATPSTKRNP